MSVNRVDRPIRTPSPSGAERNVELTATLDGAIELVVDGREVQRTFTPELEPGAMRDLCRTPLTWRLRRVLIEGRRLIASVEGLRAAVNERHLVQFGL